jgi:RNA polymerase primary sigma factor
MAKPSVKKKQDKKQAVEVLQPIIDPQQDSEARRTRLKALIVLGKERGYLTYAEINDHLPDMLEVEQIEGVVSMINDMGITVCDVAPDAETLIMTDTAPVAADEDAAEEAEAALSTVDSEFGRTTDPVRMYMREMGTVELLTREGEIRMPRDDCRNPCVGWQNRARPVAHRRADRRFCGFGRRGDHRRRRRRGGGRRSRRERIDR